MKDLIPIEHENQRVLTTEQLAEVYECEPKNIRMNFANNKDHFIEGKHYYKLEGETLRRFKNDTKNIGIVGNRVNILYLWTKRGASRHSKMLGTDKAWEMFDMLEENYFNPVPKQLSPAEEMARGLLAAHKMLEEKEQRIKELEPDAAYTVGFAEFIHYSCNFFRKIPPLASQTRIFITLLIRKRIDSRDDLTSWMRNRCIIKSPLPDIESFLCLTAVVKYCFLSFALSESLYFHRLVPSE